MKNIFNLLGIEANIMDKTPVEKFAIFQNAYLIFLKRATVAELMGQSELTARLTEIKNIIEEHTLIDELSLQKYFDALYPQKKAECSLILSLDKMETILTQEQTVKLYFVLPVNVPSDESGFKLQQCIFDGKDPSSQLKKYLQAHFNFHVVADALTKRNEKNHMFVGLSEFDAYIINSQHSHRNFGLLVEMAIPAAHLATPKPLENSSDKFYRIKPQMTFTSDNILALNAIPWKGYLNTKRFHPASFADFHESYWPAEFRLENKDNVWVQRLKAEAQTAANRHRFLAKDNTQASSSAPSPDSDSESSDSLSF
jgi:hypothetical protein